jgi:glutamate-1-semialdehyde 2,1-aminomutase
MIETTAGALEARTLALIPGGTQLLSKRPEQFAPGQWPRFYSRAKGARVWDLEGREYLDMTTSGIGCCVLGMADDDVDEAVRSAISNGSMSSLNCAEDLELAELLCELHPWAGMVRYARSGGEALVIAVRLARASTRRGLVAFCGYHGWHDWYLAANLGGDDALDGHLLPGLSPDGVPRALRDSSLPFRYGRLDELEAIAREHGAELAAIVMEPARGGHPPAGFLEGVREIASTTGAALVFDEVTTAMRMTTGGIHLRYGVEPDVAVFAKGISNGYPMAALIGVPRIMEAAERTFVSSTYWTERIGPTAALATLRKHRDRDAGAWLTHVGCRVQEGWRAAADTAGVPVTVGGLAPLASLTFGDGDAQATATLFTQLLLERGYLAGRAFYPNLTHSDADIDAYLRDVGVVFGLLAEAQQRGEVRQRLRGPVAQAGFARLT